MVDTSNPTTSDEQQAGNPINAGNLFGETGNFNNLLYNNSGSENALNAYTTYNYLFTLAILSKSQYNSGEMPYPSQFQNILIRSQGDWGNMNRVVTEFGPVDFYMDDLSMELVVNPGANKGATVGTKISFTIIEPYSVGLFYEALAIGAANAGFTNQSEAVYVLGIEFAGYDINDNPSINPSLTRYVTFIIANCVMSVTHAGCTYSVTASPAVSPTLEKTNGETQTTVAIKGTTVHEFLSDSSPTSLKAAIKTMYSQFIKDKTLTMVDDIDIRIVDNPALPGVANTIGSSVLFKDNNSGGVQPHPDMDKFWDPKAGIWKQSSLSLKPDRLVHIAKDTPIGQIITDVILMSDYIPNQFQGGQFQTDSQGMINWFAVRVKTQQGAYSPQLNRNIKLYIWEIFPFKVHVYKFLPPKTQPPGYNELRNSAAKTYNYIYTGDNTEIIRWDIIFNHAYTSLRPLDTTTNTIADLSNVLFNSGIDTTSVGMPSAASAPTKELSAQVSLSGSGSIVPRSSSSGAERSKTIQARVLQGILDSNTDLVTVDLQIRGDPFWLGNDITGNVTGIGATYNTMQDGTVNVWSGQINIVLNFRNPIDLDPVTGLYKFIAQADTISGIYWINQVIHSFSKGKFIQTLKGDRATGQQGQQAEVIGSGASIFPAGLAGAGGFQFAGALFRSLASAFNFGDNANVDGNGTSPEDNNGEDNSLPDNGTTGDDGEITVE